jgi:hypothetical protein
MLPLNQHGTAITEKTVLPFYRMAIGGEIAIRILGHEGGGIINTLLRVLSNGYPH